MSDSTNPMSLPLGHFRQTLSTVVLRTLASHRNCLQANEGIKTGASKPGQNSRATPGLGYTY